MKAPPEKLAERRMRILADLRAGMAPARVAERHGVSRQTVWNVHRAWARGGEAAVAARGEAGRRQALSARFLASLRRALARPLEEGRRPAVWTVRKATALVARKLGMPVSVVTVRAALRAPEVGLFADRTVPWLAPGTASRFREELAALRREAREGNGLLLAAFAEPSPGDPPCLRLAAMGARQPVRAALVRGAGTPRDVAGFLAAVRAEAGRPCWFAMEAGTLPDTRRVERIVAGMKGVKVEILDTRRSRRARRPLRSSV